MSERTSATNFDRSTGEMRTSSRCRARSRAALTSFSSSLPTRLAPVRRGPRSARTRSRTCFLVPSQPALARLGRVAGGRVRRSAGSGAGAGRRRRGPSAPGRRPGPAGLAWRPRCFGSGSTAPRRSESFMMRVPGGGQVQAPAEELEAALVLDRLLDVLVGPGPVGVGQVLEQAGGELAGDLGGGVGGEHRHAHVDRPGDLLGVGQDRLEALGEEPGDLADVEADVALRLVEDQRDVVGRDPQLVERLQEHAEVADAGQVDGGQREQVLADVEGGQHDLGEGGRRVDHQVVAVAPEDVEDAGHVGRADAVGLGRVLGGGQDGEAALVGDEELVEVLAEVEVPSSPRGGGRRRSCSWAAAAGRSRPRRTGGRGRPARPACRCGGPGTAPCWWP